MLDNFYLSMSLERNESLLKLTDKEWFIDKEEEPCKLKHTIKVEQREFTTSKDNLTLQYLEYKNSVFCIFQNMICPLDSIELFTTKDTGGDLILKGLYRVGIPPRLLNLTLINMYYHSCPQVLLKSYYSRPSSA